MNMKEYTPESMKQEATNLLNILIHDESMFYEVAGILEEPSNIKDAAINIRAFAQNYFDEYEHFFSVFDMDEVDWVEFALQLAEFDKDS
jgi:hypothetical protein